mmetsp:Transcript_9931/g.17411  ORF Transcript_9931/g.17411 Transcript_9931/m.17411 type:complete len:226 (+) Transcript_9931:914-1591(+)
MLASNSPRSIERSARRKYVLASSVCRYLRSSCDEVPSNDLVRITRPVSKTSQAILIVSSRSSPSIGPSSSGFSSGATALVLVLVDGCCSVFFSVEGTLSGAASSVASSLPPPIRSPRPDIDSCHCFRTSSVGSSPFFFLYSTISWSSISETENPERSTPTPSPPPCSLTLGSFSTFAEMASRLPSESFSVPISFPSTNLLSPLVFSSVVAGVGLVPSAFAEVESG